MSKNNQQPLFELTRGESVESVHFGSIAISDNQGHLVAWYGDPDSNTFLRSSAKPFQAIPFIEENGVSLFDLSLEEIALICASHSGTDEHVLVVRSIQSKTGMMEGDLKCGIHPIIDQQTSEAMRERGEEPSQNRNTCSGKHTAMLAFASMHNWSRDDYINPNHPLQQRILKTFAEMSGKSLHEVHVAVDGCSAPNFAVPLRNAALAFAQLCDPNHLHHARAEACRTIISAMTSFPIMVAGPGEFDTRLMDVSNGRILSKGGAEGYQAMGLMPGSLGPGSPGLGIAFKVTDGDFQNRARPGIALEILNQMGALSPSELENLAEFGPSLSVKNWQKTQVGQARPVFTLNHESPSED